MTIKKKLPANISSTERLQEMLEEAEQELAQIQPKIDKLELQLQKLKELKLAKQKLITLKLSVQSILSNFSDFKSMALNTKESTKNYSSSPSELNLTTKDSTTPTKENFVKSDSATLAPSAQGVPEGVYKGPRVNLPSGAFLPELAFHQADTILKRKSSINYDLFRAIVFNGGQANTEQIRAYLIEHHIKQPASGEGFEAVEMTDISARVNYLVRKGIVRAEGRGVFSSCLGWAEAESHA